MRASLVPASCTDERHGEQQAGVQSACCVGFESRRDDFYFQLVGFISG